MVDKKVSKYEILYTLDYMKYYEIKLNLYFSREDYRSKLRKQITVEGMLGMFVGKIFNKLSFFK